MSNKENVTWMQYKTLHNLLLAGVVRIERDQYVGTAADGTVVSFGTVHIDEASVERYLQKHPTPKDW